MTKKTWISFIIISVCIIGLFGIGFYMISEPETTSNTSVQIKSLDKLEDESNTDITIPGLHPRIALVCIEKLFGLDIPAQLTNSQKEMVIACHTEQLQHLELTEQTIDLIDKRKSKDLKIVLKKIMVTCVKENTLEFGIDFVGVSQCFDEGLTQLEEAMQRGINLKKFQKGT
jgi:hypothetical protein